MHDKSTTIMDKRDEEILDLKQKLVDLMKENNEMKELILFLDDERNYARQFVRDFNNKQSMNWNSLKQKLMYLEQKQFELIRENYSLKQLCVLLDENANSSSSSSLYNQTVEKSANQLSAKTSFSVCQYILQLENEIRIRGLSLNRPKFVSDILMINSIRDTANGSPEEKHLVESISETAIKTVMNR